MVTKSRRFSVYGGSSRGVVANVVNCYFVVSKLELRSCFYVQFQANTFEKGMNF